MPRPLARPSVRGLFFLVLPVLLVALSACSPGSSGAAGSGSGSTSGGPTTPRHQKATTPQPDPDPPPQAGICRDLTYGAIGHYSDDTKPTRCSRPHTAYTFAVEQLPKDVAFDGVDIGNDSVQEEASLLCRKEFPAYLGGDASTRALSRLSVTYFLPSQQQFDLGARWVRCDVIAVQSSKVLADLPDPVKGFNDSDNALADYGLCSQGEPGTSDSTLVMCNQEHTYRALAALRLGSDKDTYPGDSVVRDEGQQRCDDYISQTLGLGGGYSYTWTYPSSDDWANGQRFGYCWNKQSS